jgi:glycosyltransferase involved in cell wall biosynthesis
MRPQVPSLLVGTFCVHVTGTSAVARELGVRLERSGWAARTTSGCRGRWLRLADMVSTAWLSRRDYSVATVDVFSGRAFVWAEIVCWVLGRLGKPYILTLRGGNLPAFARREPDRVSRLLGGAAAVTAPSPYLRELMRPYRQDLVVLPNPLDVAAYTFTPRWRPRPRLIWLRSFHRVYNPCLAVRAAARLAAGFPDVSLLMIGPDKGDGSLQQARRTAAELGIAERVVFIPGVPKSDVASWLARGDIFLNTSRVDNTPVSVMEAMATGLCIVSTSVGGIPYLLDDGGDALLVPSDDAPALDGAVRRILTDHPLAGQLSCNARRKAETWDWPAVLPAWQELLQRVASQSR